MHNPCNPLDFDPIACNQGGSKDRRQCSNDFRGVLNVLRLALSWLVLGLICWLSVSFMMSAQAHQSSTAYLSIQPSAQSTEAKAEYRLAIRDMALVLPVDTNNDQQISWGEINAQQAGLDRLLKSQLLWRNGQTDCQLNTHDQPLALDQLAGMTYVVVYLAVDCGQHRLTGLNYQVLAGIDSGHRLIISLKQPDPPHQSSTWLVASGETSLAIPASPTLTTIKTYLPEGIHHLLTGYDHVLFLFCLLVTAVYRREQRQWVAVARPSTAIKHTLYIATAFTIAHSITLTLAVLNLVSVPAQWIESIIAFSIALAALNNLFPVLGQQQIRIAFGFGLIHGFGFANVLSDLPINSWSKGVALLSFNLGIELGQLACILVFFPIALALRHGTFYRVVVFRAGSVLACMLALLWMTQRILGLNWIPG